MTEDERKHAHDLLDAAIDGRPGTEGADGCEVKCKCGHSRDVHDPGFHNAPCWKCKCDTYRPKEPADG